MTKKKFLMNPSLKWLLWALMGIAIISYFFFDRWIAMHIASMHFNVKTIMAISSLVSPQPNLTVWPMAYAFCRFYWKKESFTKNALAITLSLALTNLVVALLKVALGRARPFLFISDGTYGFKGLEFKNAFYATPSGHAAIAFSIVGILTFLYPRYAILLFVLGLTLGATRVLLLEHFLSDIFLSAFLGYLISYGILKLFYLEKHS